MLLIAYHYLQKMEKELNPQKMRLAIQAFLISTNPHRHLWKSNSQYLAVYENTGGMLDYVEELDDDEVIKNQTNVEVTEKKYGYKYIQTSIQLFYNSLPQQTENQIIQQIYENYPHQTTQSKFSLKVPKKNNEVAKSKKILKNSEKFQRTKNNLSLLLSKVREKMEVMGSH